MSKATLLYRRVSNLTEWHKLNRARILTGWFRDPELTIPASEDEVDAIGGDIYTEFGSTAEPSKFPVRVYVEAKKGRMKLTCTSRDLGYEQACSPRGIADGISFCSWYIAEADGLVIGRDDATIAEISDEISAGGSSAMLVIERDGTRWRCNGIVQDACGCSGYGHNMHYCEVEPGDTEPTAWDRDCSGGIPMFRTWASPPDSEDCDSDD